MSIICLLESLRRLQSEMDYIVCSEDEPLAKFSDSLGKIIAEHERSAGCIDINADLLSHLKRTTKWIEGAKYGAPCPEDGIKLVNDANSLIEKAESPPTGPLTDCDMWDDESV